MKYSGFICRFDTKNIALAVSDLFIFSGGWCHFFLYKPFCLFWFQSQDWSAGCTLPNPLSGPEGWREGVGGELQVNRGVVIP